MKRYLLLIFYLIALAGYSQTRDYKVIIRDDSSYWDEQRSGIRSKKIIVPENNLKEVEIKISWELQGMIDKEVAYNVNKLKNAFADFPSNPILKENRINYKTSDGLYVIYSTISVNYEYTEIAVLIVFDSKTTMTYSESSKLGEEIKLYALYKDGSKYKLYGLFHGNPDMPCGGDFCLTYENNKRILEYSYCEENH